MTTTPPRISMSRRTPRPTPFTTRVNAAGVKVYASYNNTLLASSFRSLEEDYWHLCQHVQVWDVSCERQVQIRGVDADELVQLMTPRDLSAAQEDQCFYIPLCDERGGMINDPIAIRIDPQTWWLSIADSDVLLWAKGLAIGKGFKVEITEPDVCPLAIQGPKADTLMQRVFGDVVNDIRFFRYKRLAYQGHEFIVARSGWSRQGGFEVYVDNAPIGQALWDELFAQGEDLNVGIGCPNVIERIEGGLISFGNDMSYDCTPLQYGLDKYCHLDKDLPSLGMDALRRQRDEGVPSRLIGLACPALTQIPNAHTPVSLEVNGRSAGYVTSNCVSPRYRSWLAYAMLDSEAINALQQGARLSMENEFGRYEALYSDLPFDFAALDLSSHPAP